MDAFCLLGASERFYNSLRWLVRWLVGPLVGPLVYRSPYCFSLGNLAPDLLYNLLTTETVVADRKEPYSSRGQLLKGSTPQSQIFFKFFSNFSKNLCSNFVFNLFFFQISFNLPPLTPFTQLTLSTPLTPSTPLTLAPVSSSLPVLVLDKVSKIFRNMMKPFTHP
jgi:hypothetical protein